MRIKQQHLELSISWLHHQTNRADEAFCWLIEGKKSNKLSFSQYSMVKDAIICRRLHKNASNKKRYDNTFAIKNK